jgi:hypothetical protein
VRAALYGPRHHTQMSRKPTRSKTTNETMAITMHSMNHGFLLSGVVAREARMPASVALAALTPALHATTFAVWSATDGSLPALS